MFFEFLEDLGSQYLQVFGPKHFRDARIVLVYPGVQTLFGALDDRVNCPERIVQIQGYGANVFHVLPAA